MPCDIEGCDRPRKGGGRMCSMHYERQRLGKIMAPGPLSGLRTDRPGDRPFVDLYLMDVNGCWIWEGSVHSSGYGSYRGVLAHRYSYEMFVGPIPEGYQIDHVRARGCASTLCVNPEHLEAVTPRVNVLRSDAPGALAVRTNKCVNGHEFTPENTHWRSDGTGRACMQCNRDRARARALEKSN